MKHIDLVTFQKRKYLENLKLLSRFKQEKSSAYIYLFATFLSLSFLVLFAIGPTIGTIVELQKKLEDSRNADAALTEKIQNLNNLRQQYNQISSDLPYIMNALPSEPMVTDLLGRIQAVAGSNNVRVRSLSSSKISLSSTTDVAADVVEPPSFDLSLTVTGDYRSLLGFLKGIATFDRILTITSFSVSRDEGEGSSEQDRILSVEGKAYYQK